MELFTDGFFLGMMLCLAVVGGLWWAVGQSLKAPEPPTENAPSDHDDSLSQAGK